MEQKIRQYMKNTEIIGRNLQCLPEVSSTNTLLKEMALQGAEEGLVLIADHQTAGRGRQNRIFDSPIGQGIYLSTLLKPQLPPERFLPVTALAGEAVCNAIDRVTGIRPGLKWPNDPVLNERKISGILAESLVDTQGTINVILGIGINVLQQPENFPPELKKIATSLAIELGQNISREKLAGVLIQELDRMYKALLSGDLSEYQKAYRCDCVHLGKEVKIVDGIRQERVKVLGISDDFGLLVRNSQGVEQVIRSGEISVRGLYGYV